MAEPMTFSQALGRLFQTHFHRQLPADELEASLAGPLDLETSLEWLDELGVDAALHHYRSGVPPQAAPAVMELREGGWIVLHQATLQGFWVEAEAGWDRFWSRQELGPRVTGRCVRVVISELSGGSLWARMKRALVLHRGLLFYLLMTALLFNGLTLTTPHFTRWFVNHGVAEGDATLLPLLAWGIFAITAFRALVGWLLELLFLSLSTRLEYALEQDLLEHLLWLPFRGLEAFSLGELLEKFEALGRFIQWLDGGALNVLMDLGFALIFLGLMYRTLPGPSLGFLGALLLMGAGGFVLGPAIARLHRQRQVLKGQESGFLVEMIKGLQTIRATGAFSWCLQRWRRRFLDERACGLARERRVLGLDSGVDFLNNLLQSVGLVWGGYAYLRGQTDVGTLMAFLVLAGLFLRHGLVCIRVLREHHQVRPDIEALDACLTLPSGVHVPVAFPRELRGPVMVDDVWFRYAEGAPWVLQGLSFSVEPGTVKLIHGPSGFGKSTLMKLLAGLYEPTSGRISLGGSDPRSAPSMMIFLPQFTTLLNGTVLDNLHFFSGRASEARLREVAEEIGLLEWLLRLPQGLDTVVANGGANLSGGQRQHLLMGAALASRKPVLLMDEAMSNLDWVTRRRVMENRHFKGKTVIYTSHEERLEA